MELLVIDGVDVGAMCPRAGYTVEYDFINGGQGGLMMDGTQSVDELTQKEVVSFPLLPLTKEQAEIVLDLIVSTPLHQVRYISPRLGQVQKTMRRSVSNIQYRGFGATGNEYWTGLVITLRDK